MALLHYLWSRVAASNATADSNVNWSEGQSPSSVNDSARSMMASAAGFRDDIAGAITTGGTSTAYTVASYQVFDTLGHLNGQMIAFTPHVTCGDNPTLNVDGLGAKNLRVSTASAVSSGMLIAGTPYVALYNNSDSSFYLHSFFGNPYNIPLGGVLPYFGSSAPNSNFAIPLGQAISRTTYAALFSLISTTYGVGDGSTTFNVPDLGGRTLYGKEATATRLTTAGGGLDGGTLGAVGGAQNGTILQANLPNVNFTVASGQSVTVTSTRSDIAIGGSSQPNTGGSAGAIGGTVTVTSTGTVTGTGSAASGGSGTAFKTVAPGMVCNYILRII